MARVWAVRRRRVRGAGVRRMGGPISSPCRASAPSTRSIASVRVWQGERCSGRLVAGDRYRYRALKPHGEVIFWTVGTKDKSGKFGELRDPGRAQLGCARLARMRRARSRCAWCRARR